jgi:hypothetical protein
MKTVVSSYEQFVQWVQTDMNQARVSVNRKVFSVVLWCLFLPILMAAALFAMRKLQWIEHIRYLDTVLYLPPFIYALYSIWPMIRDLPKVFQRGGVGAMLEESAKEVRWIETTSARLEQDLKLTPMEWKAVRFHLENDLQRMQDQNRYMTILTSVVLFFMFQFLDLGGTDEVIMQTTPTGMVKSWVDQFSQWSIQVISLVLFSALFYLSGLQFQRYLRRYWVSLERLALEQGESGAQTAGS